MKNGCVRMDHTEMYYVSFGSGKRNLVVLPGLSDGLATVKGKAILLSFPYKRFLKDYTVFMFSRKNKMPEGYTIRQMAEDQARAMEALDIRKAAVLGVSQGGMISQYLAIDHPEKIEKMVLAVTAPYANHIVQNVVGNWIEMASSGDHPSLMADTARKMYSESYLERSGRWFPLIARFTKPKSYERFLRNAYAIMDFDAREDLPRTTCPALIIAGEDDKIVGNKAPYELHESISGSELFVYPGLGHGAYEEGRDFYDRVYSFCESQL